VSDELDRGHTLITELHWREFFTYIMHHFPQVKTEPFRKKYAKIPWSRNMAHFGVWKSGKTGFPIVDAGMRQLNLTGFMHNRVRMIAASFLTKDLHIDWKLGERYFAEKLVDYDPAVNNGNWQWVASTGCDAQPWFRVFNPWLQQEKFDADCTYIRRWVPELRDVGKKEIHRWYEKYAENAEYPRPIVDHIQESAVAKRMFHSA